MAVEPLQTWKDELENLPKVADGSWSLNFANWYADMISGIEPDSSALTPSGFVFTFPVAIFASALSALSPTTDAVAGITGFATAWETALLASTSVVGPGSFIPPATPATTFSVVASSLIDPASIAAGKAKLLELVTAPPAADAQDSEFPIKFREATLLLTFTVIGTNSDSPTTAPLTAPLVPFI
jgi:hypothetical protein